MPTLFFSYSHKDEKLRDQLEVHLAMLKREGVIEAWHDRKISVGDAFDCNIDVWLERADVVLLLVSSDFLASAYCYDVEVQRAMERHKQGSARVIPVVLRPCDWMSAPFGALLAAPRDGKPVTRWANRDEAFLDITLQIRLALRGQDPIETIPRAPVDPLISSVPFTHTDSGSAGDVARKLPNHGVGTPMQRLSADHSLIVWNRATDSQKPESSDTPNQLHHLPAVPHCFGRDTEIENTVLPLLSKEAVDQSSTDHPESEKVPLH